MENSKDKMGVCSGRDVKLQYLHLLVQFLILLMVEIGFYYSFISAYQIYTEYPVVVFIIACCFVFTLFHAFRNSLIFFALSFAAGGIWVWFNADQLVQSWLFLIKRCLVSMQIEVPLIIEQLLNASQTECNLALISLMFYGCMLSSICVSKWKSPIGLILCSIFPIIAAPFFNLSPDSIPFFLMITGYFVFYVFKKNDPAFINNSWYESEISLYVNKKKAGKKYPAQFLACVLSAALFASVLLVTKAIYPEESYRHTEVFESLKDKFYNSKFGEMFGKPFNGLSHGNFRDNTKIRFDGSNAFKVSVSEPVSLYLKNYVGVIYAETGWKEDKDSNFKKFYSGHSTMPQLLHSKFGAQLLQNEKEYHISFKAGDESFEHLLLPPGIVTSAQAMKNVTYSNDTGYRSSKDKGLREYTVSALRLKTAFSTFQKGKGANYEEIKKSYYSIVKKTYKNNEALKAASAYLDYIFKMYTELPGSAMSNGRKLCEEFGLFDILSGSNLNLAEICRAVQTVLSQNCSYSYEPPEIPESEDFTTYFIKTSREGYCVHFATAAVVLLRAAGIPARYAEGYILVQSDYTKEKDLDGFISIEDTHAHAWAEVFDPVQLEWIPIEMTPNESDSPEIDSDIETTNNPEDDSTPEPEEEVNEQNVQETPEPSWQPESDDTGMEDEIPEQVPDSIDEADGLEDNRQQSNEESDNSSYYVQDSESENEEGSTDDYGVFNESDGLSKAVLPMLTVLIILGSFVGLYFARKKWRQLKYSESDKKNVISYSVHDADKLIRLSGGSSIESYQTPAQYAVGLIRKLEWIDPENIMKIFTIAQYSEFSGKEIDKELCETMIGQVKQLKERTLKQSNVFVKLVIRYWLS